MHEEPTVDPGQRHEEGGLDTAQLQYLRDRLRSEQNLGAGILTGALAALVGALLWAGVTVATGFQIGWMAIGIGFLVGYAIRTFGRGSDKLFGIAGAILSLLGCLAGNLLAVCGMIAIERNMSIFALLRQLDFKAAVDLMIATFSPMDLLFYGIAVWEGYKLSFRRITEQELERMLKGERSAAG